MKTINEPEKEVSDSDFSREPESLKCFGPLGAAESIKALKIKSILVPIDFSEPSKVALTHAAAFAKLFGATLNVLHVVEPMSPPDLPYSCPLVMDTAEIVAEGTRRLDQFVKEQAVDSTLIAKTLVTQDRSFQGIVTAARSLKADLIIISTHGYTGLKHLLIGSTAERVVRHAPCPVLIVRPQGSPGVQTGDKPSFQLRKILVPLDFSTYTATALKYAIAFARRFHAEQTLLYAVHPTFYFTGADGEAVVYAEMVEEDRRAGIKQMAEVLKNQELKELKTSGLVPTGDPRTEILNAAVDLGTNLIILSTHGRTGLKHVLLGSVAEHVVRHATCNVLVVREQQT